MPGESDSPLKVVVTGGSGYLGQHIVKLLQEQCPLRLTEIVVFDIVPFEQRLEYSQKIKLTSSVGDITKRDDVMACLCNANAVIHCCSYISVGIGVDNKKLQTINVQGTRNVLDACKANGVTSLVYTSSEDVVMGMEYIVHGDETLPYPDIFRYEEYGRTKCQAEQMVLAADETQLETGELLRTIAIRPDTFYGELDNRFVTEGIQIAKSMLGYMPSIGAGTQPCSYVGNTAWGHIKALETLCTNPDRAGGEAFFITDDTPPMSFGQLQRIFLPTCGLKVLPIRVPLFMMYFIATIVEIVAFVLSPIFTVKSVFSRKIVSNIYHTHSYSHAKATRLLGYKPFFTYEESVKLSTNFYAQL